MFFMERKQERIPVQVVNHRAFQREYQWKSTNGQIKISEDERIIIQLLKFKEVCKPTLKNRSTFNKMLFASCDTYSVYQLDIGLI